MRASRRPPSDVSPTTSYRSNIECLVVEPAASAMLHYKCRKASKTQSVGRVRRFCVKPAFLHQCFDARVTAAEFAIGVRGVDGIAERQHARQAPRYVGVEGTARLRKRLEGIGGDDVRPEIAIVAGRVAVAGEHVQELWRPVPHDHFARHPDLTQRVALEWACLDATFA